MEQKRIKIVKGLDNSQNPSKQYFTILSAENTDSSLCIVRLVLVNNDNAEIYSYHCLGFKQIFSYNNKVLMFTSFAIKLSTINKIKDELIKYL